MRTSASILFRSQFDCVPTSPQSRVQLRLIFTFLHSAVPMSNIETTPDSFEGARRPVSGAVGAGAAGADSGAVSIRCSELQRARLSVTVNSTATLTVATFLLRASTMQNPPPAPEPTVAPVCSGFAGSQRSKAPSSRGRPSRYASCSWL